MKILIFTAFLFLVLQGQQIPSQKDLEVFDQLSYLSFSSYCDSRKLASLEKQWNCGEMCQKGSQLQDVKYCVTEDRNFAILGFDTKSQSINIAFRGTISTSFKNWMTDLDYKKIDLNIAPGLQVHSGFYSAYIGLRNCLVNSFKQLKIKYNKNTVRITGHSLGGALATLGAVDLFYFAKQNADYFVTYGSPKVGNLEFQKYFNNVVKPAKNFRITHFRDPVPFVPMEMQGFLHVGTNVAYNEDSSKYEISSTDYYKYGVSITDHLTYMGKDWEKIQASSQCNYPDQTKIDDPYRKYYPNYLLIKNCEKDNIAQNGANAKGCTKDGCFMIQVEGKIFNDEFIGGKCIQKISKGLSEFQTIRQCSIPNSFMNYDGSYCCKQEKVGSIILGTTDVKIDRILINKKYYCQMKPNAN